MQPLGVTLFALLMTGTPLLVQAQSGTFGIWSDNERVGSILVDRILRGDTILYTMRSSSEVEVMFWTQKIRTSVTAKYVGDRVQACGSTVHVNDVMRDSSNMHVRQGVVRGYVHPAPVNATCDNAWTTARMYYEEPVGRTSIYVESLLRDFPLETVGAGVYRLLLPDDKVNRYVYRNGVLQEVQVDRSFFDLVFRRV